MRLEDLIQEIEEQKAVMIEVATGRLRIQEANESYVTRRDRIKAGLTERSIRDPNVFSDRRSLELPSRFSKIGMYSGEND